MPLRPRAQSESRDCTRVPHGDGLQPPTLTFLSRWGRARRVAGRVGRVAAALVLFTLALPGVVAA